MMTNFTSDIPVDGASAVGTAGNEVINDFAENDTLFFDGGTYSIDSSGKNAFIVSEETANSDDSDTAGEYSILAETFVEALQHKTEAGYPLIAGLFFHPNEYHGFKNLGSSYYADSDTLTINSSDGLELTGYHYTPKNPNDKWVILVHGYGHNHKHMNGFARQYLTNNYHVLMVDQRAAGDSEGEWLTMSAAEGEDVALWTHKIAELNPNAKITLHGVSMGAATAMLAAANPDLTNVTSLIEDCGYTRVLDLIDLVKGLIPELADSKFINAINDTSESLTGYPLTAAAPIDSLGNATMPSMFITGTADQVINPAMLESLYSASGAGVKEIFTVAGATHGLSGLKDSIGYGNAVFRFNAEAAGEGWITSNVTNNISLRGTKYGDTITSSGNYVTIIGGKGNDILTGGKGKDTIYGGAGKDSLVGNAGNDYLNGGNGNDYLDGGKGNDTLNGGKGNDTLKGGAGKDIFVYSAGTDVITDYTAGQDKIKITSGKITKATVSGKNVIFKVGSGTITVKNGKGKKISIENANGKTSTKTYSNSTVSQLWFAEENNFISADNLGSIVKNDSTPIDCKIDTKNLKNLIQQNDFITFTGQ